MIDPKSFTRYLLCARSSTAESGCRQRIGCHGSRGGPPHAACGDLGDLPIVDIWQGLLMGGSKEGPLIGVSYPQRTTNLIFDIIFKIRLYVTTVFFLNVKSINLFYVNI